VKDAAMLDSVSPVLLADRIKAPLLLAYGGEDRRVPLVHGTRMRDALTAAGRPPQWVVYSDEGHGWYKLENQLDFARRMEDFLARHLR
jgi:dipeptidyl aminopeptidase/acylaminoacyl peptidase